MRVTNLVVILGLLTTNIAQAQPNKKVQFDYRTVNNLEQHLPLTVPEANDLDDATRRDVECLSWTLYFESRGGTSSEQIAIAWIPIKRIGKPDFGNSICENVFQYTLHSGRKRFQFSWVGILLGPKWKREDDAWDKMQRLAIKVISNDIQTPTKNALYFRSAQESCNWAPNSKTVKIGYHLFWPV